jgi:hypothetical protein
MSSTEHAKRDSERSESASNQFSSLDRGLDRELRPKWGTMRSIAFAESRRPHGSGEKVPLHRNDGSEALLLGSDQRP